MHDEVAFLQALQEHPDEDKLRLVFADWLEECGDPRAELLRLLHTLTQAVVIPERSKLEDRLRSLLAAGVQPVGPFITNSLGMKLAWIPAGTFLMGSPVNEEGRNEGEIQHKVTLSKGFYLAIHPVNQTCWHAVMGNNPSMFMGDDLPVETVSWEDCQEFLGKLSNREGHGYRLPTEAEWEYACRAGTTTPFYFGDTSSPDQVNYNVNDVAKAGKTTPVGSYPLNAWGLHDMHGNVWELCADWLGAYPPGDVVDPLGAQSGKRLVSRGGSFNSSASNVRSAYRGRHVPTDRSPLVGFRPARTFA